MYTLYARAGAGSQAPEALLELVGADYALEPVERGAASESFRKLNPLGQVPVLVLPGGEVLTESAAIMIHLADSFPEARLAPAIGDPGRGQYLRWMLFLATTIYMDDLRLIYPQRYTDDPAGAPFVKSAAARQIEANFAVYAAALGDRHFMLGDKMSGLDIYAAMLATWMPDVPAFLAAHPNMKATYDRVVAVPAVGRVWVRNGVADY
jgi:glutathione S-transferase